VLNDGGGGGGAGGSVIVIAVNGAGNVGTLTVTATGGDGGVTWPARTAPIDRHGPGGGGGGGFIFTSGALALGSVSGGLNGTSTTALDPFGATPGGPGVQVTNITPADVPNFITPGNCIPTPTPVTRRAAAVNNDPAVSGFLIPVTGFAPNIVTELNIASRPAYKSTNLTIEIPVIKVNTSIIGIPKKKGDWDLTWLQDQAGWLNGTAYPTWTGNSVLTAHVVNADGKPGIFSKLKYLGKGEYIFIYNGGYRYTYKVVSNEFVRPTDSSVLKHEDKAYLTLITCDSYNETTATYLRRVVVRAVLVDTREAK
jgi:LPXTG-site transpeptidase (sortase) family protein